MRKVPVALPVASSPIIRRVTWHLRRVVGQLDRRFFLSLAQGILILVGIAAVLITAFEKPLTFESLFDSFNWGIATVLGQGDAGFVYTTDVRTASDRIRAIAIPPWAQPKVHYEVAVVRSSEHRAAARAWVARLSQGRSRRLLRASGFGIK